MYTKHVIQACQLIDWAKEERDQGNMSKALKIMKVVHRFTGRRFKYLGGKRV